MLNILAIPRPIELKLEELNEIINENPQYIPLTKVATFLGCDANGLRASIDKGQCPFGIGWKKSEFGNAAYKIPTATFYLWYTQGTAFRYYSELELTRR